MLLLLIWPFIVVSDDNIVTPQTLKWYGVLYSITQAHSSNNTTQKKKGVVT
jgi:hypothetical protein